MAAFFVGFLWGVIMGMFDDLNGTQAGGDMKQKDTGAREKRAAGISSYKKKQASKKNPPANVAPFPDVKTSERVDVFTAAGDPVEMLPASIDDVARLLPVWVESWQAAENVPDIRKASPLLFNSLCIYIGNSFIKPSRILKDTTRTAAGACVGSTCNRYNPASVAAVFDVFTAFCSSCDKIPFQRDFAAFCGVSVFYVREYVQGLTSAGLNITKKTRDAELNAIRQAASRDPVGRLAILNNEFWNTSGAGGSDVQARGAALPVGGSFGLIESGRLD